MLSLIEVDREGAELDEFRVLLREYEEDLGVDLCFQGFEEQVAQPLIKYGPPSGCILIAHWDWETAGCGALTDLGDGVCELKRVFVRKPFRRLGIARIVSQTLMDRAVELGYRAIRLDTLRRLAGAVELYRSLGFTDIEPYNFNPMDDIVYMERPLPQTLPST